MKTTERNLRHNREYLRTVSYGKSRKRTGNIMTEGMNFNDSTKPCC